MNDSQQPRPGFLMTAGLPEVECATGEAPFVAASTYPNGAIAVATLERGIIRRSYTPEAIVTIEAGAQDAPIGIFGAYSALHVQVC